MQEDAASQSLASVGATAIVVARLVRQDLPVSLQAITTPSVSEQRDR